MTIETMFEQLKDFRNTPDDKAAIRIPVLLMGYMNPICNMVLKSFAGRLPSCR